MMDPTVKVYAEYLEQLGYFVIAKERLRILSVSQSVSLDLLENRREADRYLDHMVRQAGVQIGQEAVSSGLVHISDLRLDREPRHQYNYKATFVVPL